MQTTAAPTSRFRLVVLAAAAVILSASAGCAHTAVDGSGSSTVAAPAIVTPAETTLPAVPTSPGTPCNCPDESTPVAPSSVASAPITDITDFSYYWNAGSMMPPYGYTWTLDVRGTAATFTWDAQVPDGIWTRSYQLTAEQAMQLRADVAEALTKYQPVAGEDQSIGGRSSGLEYQQSDGPGGKLNMLGTTDSSMALYDRLQRLMIGAVPADTFNKIEAEYHAFVDEQEG